jgi:hypothetical protein
LESDEQKHATSDSLVMAGEIPDFGL